jgi:hypothetical protein
MTITKTKGGNKIEIVSEVEIENIKGEIIGTAKVGLVISDNKKHRGLGIENASFDGVTKKIAIKDGETVDTTKYYRYKRKDEEKIYLSEQTVQKVLSDPKFKELSNKYYGA